VTIDVFSHGIKWFREKYIQHKSRSKFRKFNERIGKLMRIHFYFVEIVTDEMLAKKIKAIEDVLGNELYFFSLKTDRKQINRQNHFNDERVELFSFSKQNQLRKIQF
jgi:hypothetical protein